MRYKLYRLGALLCCLFLHRWCDAQFGGNLAFDGSTQSVSTPPGMMNGATTFTIEFFVKTTENRTNGTYWQRPTLVGNATSGDISGDFGITTNNGFVGMWAGLNNTTDNSFLSSVQINDNNWHHVAAVNNGTQLKLFVDGALLGTLTTGRPLVSSNASLSIGACTLDFGFSGNVGNKNFFSAGMFDEVRFSNNVRYTSNFSISSAAFTADTNTIALYHLDGCVNNKVPDASSNNNYGTPTAFTTGSCVLVLPPVPTIAANPPVYNVSKAEYFIDTDPGFGAGNSSISFAAASDVTITNASISLAGLSNGSHRFYVRTKNIAGAWSHTAVQPFYIVNLNTILPANSNVTNISRIEYFIDADPGFGAGINIPFTGTTDATATNFPVTITGLSNGVHVLYARSKMANGNWSHTNPKVFYIVNLNTVIPANITPTNVVKMEYFVDTDPGFGNATPFNITANNDVTLNNYSVIIGALSTGVHRLYVRSKDASGKWSLTNAGNFAVVNNITLPGNPAPGTVRKLEYFVDTDPGFGKGTIINVGPTADLSSYSFSANIGALGIGNHVFYIRSFDAWSLTSAYPFMVGGALPLNLLSFTGQKQNNIIGLEWKTTKERGTKYFDVERSTDAVSFTAIIKVTAQATTAVTKDYHVDDVTYPSGVLYYRLKMVDADGKFTYSPIVRINAKAGININVYPNPAKDVTTIEWPGAIGKPVAINLLNQQGQLVKQWMEKATAQIQLNLTGLATGAYLMMITDGENNYQQKILVGQ